MGNPTTRLRHAVESGAPSSRRGYLRAVAAGLAGAVAGCVTEVDPAIEYFGRSVALDRDTALVGAGWNHAAEEEARGYVFSRRDGEWGEQADLPIPTGRPSHHFEIEPAVDGDTALIGIGTTEHSNMEGKRSAYVFTRRDEEWDQEAELTGDEAGAAFGDAVALDGDAAIIGAPKESRDGDGVGAVYVFARAGGDWKRDAKLPPDDADANDDFASAIALDGDRALVGAEFDEDSNGNSAGSAYVFVRTTEGWHQEATLAPDDGDSFDHFGASVALDGDTALVGAYKDEDPNGFEAGSAYVFARTENGWIERAKLAAGNGDRDDRFGASVALDGDLALVGASADEGPVPVTSTTGSTEATQPTAGATVTDTDRATANGTATDREASPSGTGTNTDTSGRAIDRNDSGGDGRGGTVHVFSRADGEWTQETELTVDGGGFGGSVAIDGDTALVSAPEPMRPGGSAYVFPRTSGEWSRQSRFSVEFRPPAISVSS